MTFWSILRRNAASETSPFVNIARIFLLETRTVNTLSFYPRMILFPFLYEAPFATCVCAIIVKRANGVSARISFSERSKCQGLRERGVANDNLMAPNVGYLYTWAALVRP